MKRIGNSKKTLIVSMIAFLFCCTTLIGTTFAWFTDSSTSGNNRIQAGNLNISMLYKNEITEDWTAANEGAILSCDNMEPGKIVWAHIGLMNDGKLSLKYKLSLVSKGDIGELADVIDVYLDESQTIPEEIPTKGGVTSMRSLGKLKDVLDSADKCWEGVLSPKPESSNYDVETASEEPTSVSTMYATIVLKMQDSVESSYQNKTTGNFDIHVDATQYTGESDSFGDGYDTDVAYRNFEKVYTFDSDSELADFDPILVKPENTAGHGLVIDEGKAVVNQKGAFIRFGANLNDYSYVIEYDVDASKLEEGQSIKFETGETATWAGINHITVENNGGWKLSIGAAANDPTSYIANKEIENIFHVKTVCSLDEGRWVTTTTVTDGTNTYEAFKSVEYTDNMRAIYWDVYDLSSEAAGQVALDNFTFYGLEVDKTEYVLPTLANKVEVTTDNYSTINFKQNDTHYVFSGSFESLDIQTVAGLNQIYDGSKATVAGQVKIGYEGGVAHSYETVKGKERVGKYVAYGFNAESVCVATYNTTIDIIKNNVEFINVDSANVSVNILQNVVDGQCKVHKDYQDGDNEYGVYLYMVDYDLTFDSNTVTNTKSHTVTINGMQANFASGLTSVTNVVSRFSKNTLTVRTNGKSALKIWDDTLYAPREEKTALSEAARTLIEKILDSQNNIVKAGESQYYFNFYDIKTDGDDV